jgi:hypothetical protein
VSRNVPLLNLRAEKEFGYSKATTPSRLDSLAASAPRMKSPRRHYFLHPTIPVLWRALNYSWMGDQRRSECPPNASPCPVSGSRRQRASLPQQIPRASAQAATSQARPQPCHARVHRGYPQWIHWDRRRASVQPQASHASQNMQAVALGWT